MTRRQQSVPDAGSGLKLPGKGLGFNTLTLRQFQPWSGNRYQPLSSSYWSTWSDDSSECWTRLTYHLWWSDRISDAWRLRCLCYEKAVLFLPFVGTKNNYLLCTAQNVQVVPHVIGWLSNEHGLTSHPTQYRLYGGWFFCLMGKMWIRESKYVDCLQCC